MHEKIADIQNSFWKAYKNFSKTLDANQWADEAGQIINKYRHDKHYYVTFCEDLFYGWSAILSVMRVTEKDQNDNFK